MFYKFTLKNATFYIKKYLKTDKKTPKKGKKCDSFIKNATVNKKNKVNYN